jgi:hypothetical protein
MSAGLTSEEQAILNLLRATYDRPIYRKQNRAEYLVLAIVDRLRAQLADLEQRMAARGAMLESFALVHNHKSSDEDTARDIAAIKEARRALADLPDAPGEKQ